MTEPETVEQAARQAARRWRTIAIGLALVGGTNLFNAALNTLALANERASPVICIASINDPRLSKQAIEQILHQSNASLDRPR